MIPKPPPDAPNDEHARYLRSLGLSPVPVKPGTKRPALDSWKEYQTRQPTLQEIEGWNWTGGVGIVTNGLIVVDCDNGGEALLQGKEFPPSWTVRTGGGGLARLYSGDGHPRRNAVRILKGENGVGVDIRADGGFVVLPPTLHCKTGKPYWWILPPGSMPLAPAPAWILETVREPEPVPIADRPVTDDAEIVKRARAYLAKIPGAIEGQGGDNHTFVTACKTLRGFGLTVERATQLMLEWNATCQPPWTEREIHQKVMNALKHGDEPIGQRRDAERAPRTNAMADIAPNGGSEAEQLPAEAPEADLPVFPEASYQGLAAEIASAYAECLEAPKEFFYMDTLAFLGATVCPHVRLDSQLYEEPRLYVVKVGPSWSSRKSSSQDNIERQFTPLLDNRLTPCYGTGSAEGLANLIKKGLPTVLIYDEFRSFVDKSNVHQSVLLPMVTTLFHRTVYENSTKHSEIRLTDAHLSLVAACTSETFTTMFNASFRNIGFLNRLFIVTGKRTTLKPVPEPVPHEMIKRLQDRTLAQIEKAERERPALRFTPEAKRRWEEWYRSMPDSPYAARLDTYGLRLLMLYAVTTESWQITRPLVESVLPLLDYELAVRREIDPVDAETVIAKMERLILRHLSKGRMMSKRLRDACNVKHYGSWIFDQAMKNAQRQGWVKEKKAGKGLAFWLTEGGIEEEKG